MNKVLSPVKRLMTRFTKVTGIPVDFRDYCSPGLYKGRLLLDPYISLDKIHLLQKGRQILVEDSWKYLLGLDEQGYPPFITTVVKYEWANIEYDPVAIYRPHGEKAFYRSLWHPFLLQLEKIVGSTLSHPTALVRQGELQAYRIPNWKQFLDIWRTFLPREPIPEMSRVVKKIVFRQNSNHLFSGKLSLVRNCCMEDSLPDIAFCKGIWRARGHAPLKLNDTYYVVIPSPAFDAD